MFIIGHRAGHEKTPVAEIFGLNGPPRVGSLVKKIHVNGSSFHEAARFRPNKVEPGSDCASSIFGKRADSIVEGRRSELHTSGSQWHPARMNLERTLAALNAMQDERIIGEYAIGGAVGAFYYLEPGTTFDVDIFIAWAAEPSGLLNLNPIYAYLLGKGYVPKGETISIEGWAVQFLPPDSPLVDEAIKQARVIQLDNVPTRVFTREHLMAICLDTGRPKDVARLIEFAQEGKVDQSAFADILGRHGLQEKWTRFQARFLTPW